MGEDALDVAIRQLGMFAADLRLDRVPAEVRDRLELVLLDHLGVTAAGTATVEMRQLIATTDPPSGPAPIVGAGRSTTVDLAAWFNGTSACSLELDEGNKYARGHPAVHAFPAALAIASHRPVAGQGLLEALLAGYEIAARFGAATRLATGVHPHGNWGVTGAAVAAGLLLDLDAERLAGAIDAASGLALATPFESATTGNFVRNTWTGNANTSGLTAARLAAAGLAAADDTAAWTLGRILGDLDVAGLTEGLGERWLITRGYFKRHACCSFTHPPADALLQLRGEHDLVSANVSGVTVETHRLAAGLDAVDSSTRLAAMFSIPYVTAAALVFGDCTPTRFDERARSDDEVRRLAERTRVVRAGDLDTRLPDERAARVTVQLTSGEELVGEVPNPIGDADHHPFGWPEVRQKLAAVLGPGGPDSSPFEDLVRELATADDVRPLIRSLP